MIAASNQTTLTIAGINVQGHFQFIMIDLYRAFVVTLCILIGVTKGAFAQDRYVSDLLSSTGAWWVELVFDTQDGDLWCSAGTDNTEGQTFQIAAFDSGAVALFVFDSVWDMAERPVRFLVTIDGSVWTMDGTAGGSSVSIFFNDADAGGRLLGQLAAGYNVSIANADGRTLGRFSLRGSRVSLTELMDCWDSITGFGQPGTRTDPFRTQQDPF